MSGRLALLALALLGLVPAYPARAEGPPRPREGADHAVPLYGRLLRPYDAPPDPYAPGHRGLDVAAAEGSPVRASAGGTVSFSGNVAGNLAVTIDHGGGVETTYSYLGRALVHRGDRVARGDPVGTVGRCHPTRDLPPCVHLSARRDGTYVDPFGLYVGSRYDDLLTLVS